MLKAVYVVCFLVTLLLCSDVGAEDEIFTIKMLLKRQESDTPIVHKKHKDVDKILILPLKREHILTHTFNVFKYIEERKGRIPLYSGLHGKIQLEFGLSGYLGIKCRF